MSAVRARRRVDGHAAAAVRAHDVARVARVLGQLVTRRAGGLLQDLNSESTAIEIHGSLFADERGEFLSSVREKFRQGAPLTFVADITAATDIQYVVVEDMVFEESSRFPDQIDYYLKLRESPPPPPPPPPSPPPLSARPSPSDGSRPPCDRRRRAA